MSATDKITQGQAKLIRVLFYRNYELRGYNLFNAMRNGKTSWAKVLQPMLMKCCGYSVEQTYSTYRTEDLTWVEFTAIKQYLEHANAQLPVKTK